MNFSHREMYSLSDSFALGFGTGIKITKNFSLITNLMFGLSALPEGVAAVCDLKNWVGRHRCLLS